MLVFHAREYSNLVFSLMEMERKVSKHRGELPKAIKAGMRDESAAIADFCEKLELTVAADAAKSLPQAQTFSELESMISTVRNAIFIGLNRRDFYGPKALHADYFENPKLFGNEVFAAFPSANEDITEAGSCLALERATACVMHLNRAAEVALMALGKTLGVTNKTIGAVTCV